MMKFYSFGHQSLVTTKALMLSVFFSFLLMGIHLESKGQSPATALSYNATFTNPVNSLQNKEYVTLPVGIVSSINQSFTIETWVYWRGIYDPLNPSSDVFQRIFDFGTGTATNMWLTPKSNYNSNNGVMFAYITPSLGVQVIQSNTPLATNTWVHIAVTVDHATNTGKLYINGVLDASATNTSLTIRPSDLGATTNNYFGQSQFPIDPWFNGMIEEFRISNVVRYTSNFTPPYTQFTNDVNTVALYHFNEGSGQTTADASSNGFNGILGISTSLEEDLDPDWITNSILPVKIESLSAQKQNAVVDLKWRASTTGEGGTFIVERSLNGISYEYIGNVEINDNPGSFSYSFKDTGPAKGKNFYRLRIQENNADPKLSSVVWVDMNGKVSYAVNPNISSSELFITVPEPTRLSIYNASGVLVQRVQLQASQNINISALNRGLYHIRFEGTSETLKFIRQ